LKNKSSIFLNKALKIKSQSGRDHFQIYDYCLIWHICPY